ncbi:MAG: hypothetical protein KJ060_17060 [Candidatus Hydrogenedentes bacterium]|nr:hypothetical protein [Candidatus Hydrogenedentota bacterium]
MSNIKKGEEQMRTDISVYNEATGFTIHAAEFCGIPREEVINQLRSSVEKGVVIPIRLVQDGSPHIRVVTGELKPREEAEWVDRFVWKLRVPCGNLVFEGGLDPRGPDETYMRTVPVPPGDYQVEVFTFFWGINGWDSLPSDQSEPVGAWFRRTRPGEKFPSAMKFYLGENSEDDPGHEAEWDKFYDSDEYEELDEPDFVDFLVRFTPLDPSVNLELQCDEDGWFPIGINPRKPDVCPKGINFKR